MTQCHGQPTFGIYEHKQLVADFKGGQIAMCDVDALASQPTLVTAISSLRSCSGASKNTRVVTGRMIFTSGPPQAAGTAQKARAALQRGFFWQ